MKIFLEQENKKIVIGTTCIFIVFDVLLGLLHCIKYGGVSIGILGLSFAMEIIAILSYICYMRSQNRKIEYAINQIEAYLDGNHDVRLDSDYEGNLNRLFHQINMLATILDAHAQKELREKEFLKDTISDISHQLKTPLAALNIYNGLLQSEVGELQEIKEFADLSEQELDRIDTLVQNLLKMTRLDAGVIQMRKYDCNLSELMNEIEMRFQYRAKVEQKSLTFDGKESISLYCDPEWMAEAISNIVKNALDHTETEHSIAVNWKKYGNSIQIEVSDTGHGIHPEDLPFIFKRFYRSRFSQNTSGIGLGLPLAKALIEANGGVIEVESLQEKGTTFLLSFSIPTKL